ncbi:PREDICTED: uncharacterized protein LOC108362791 [Rhagoletis zephyria]|uniref:uncharacterized protein LOC108362791 n=1 Tax=Rhagoletis zephyria TaxID=28612 RepID=UPI00081160DB|nr:PREDICTED: uncharacterized protein LOC108362791 [Rhagoletis zephyria]
MSANNCGELVSIATTEWAALRDVYRRDWPLNVYSYYALENYLNWLRKDPELCEREVRIWSVDDNWREHGIYILQDRTNFARTVRADVCSPEYIALYQLVFNYLDALPYTELLFRDKTCTAVKKYIEQLGYTPNLEECYPARLYHLSKKDCLKLGVKQCVDFIIQPLKLTDAKEVNDFWPYKGLGTQYIVERNIKYNLTLGAYHHDSGELCAWVLYSELGTIAFLYVKAPYRRRGLAEVLVRQLCRALADQDHDAMAHIEDTNEASTKLFTKLGFQAIEYNYWFIKAHFANTTQVQQAEVLMGQTMKHG